ncbi:MAG: PilZ domain-containing protein [Phycisphaerae bacterium]|nr:PilZ domain-containing protein [Phycisphaerae bacterium]
MNAQALEHTPAKMRLAVDSAERRRFARRPADASLTATYTDWQGRIGVTHIKVVDSSLTGLGVESPVELTPGMTVSLCDGAAPVATRSGVVVRCRRERDGFRVGLAFHRRAAA